MSLRVTNCVQTDAPTIASLETSTITTLLKLQLGTATPESLKTWLANKYSSDIPYAKADNKAYLKVLAPNSNGNTDDAEMIAFAEWSLPDDDDDVPEVDDDTTELDDDDVPEEDAGNNKAPPQGMNLALNREMNARVAEMQNRVLRGRKCFCESIPLPPPHPKP